MLLVIDIESYLYRASTACKTLIKDNKNSSIYLEAYDIRKGLHYLDETINNWKVKFATNDVLLVFGDENNWRKQYSKEYKANRIEKDKPLMYPILKEELIKEYDTTSLLNLEADDTCRIINEDNKTFPTRKVLISIDKDFETFPCELYNPLKDERQIITKSKAEQNLMYRILVGDTADNYIGMPGWGDKTAMKWLNEEPRTWLDLKELFREKGLLKEFEETRNLATMVSIDRYNFDTGEVKLLKDIK